MDSETQAVLHVWIGQSVQLQLKAVSKNCTIYEAIARSLTDIGYEKTGGGRSARPRSRTSLRSIKSQRRQQEEW